MVYRVGVFLNLLLQLSLGPNCICATNSTPDWSTEKSGWLKVASRLSGFLDLFLLKDAMKFSVLCIWFCWNQSDPRMTVTSVLAWPKDVYVFKTKKIYKNVIRLLSLPLNHAAVSSFPYNWWHQIKPYRGNTAHIKHHGPVYNHCKILLCQPACCIWTLYPSTKNHWHFW